MEPLIAAPTGKVVEIVGHAIVLLPDGSSRVLHVGDVLHPGERILTTQNGIVRIEDAHAAPGAVRAGTRVDIAGAENGLARATPTPHAAAHDNKSADHRAEPNGALDRVIKHINAGDAQDAPAAGLQPGDSTGGLTPGLRVERVSESVDGQHFDFVPTARPGADASAPQNVLVAPGAPQADISPPPAPHYTPLAVADVAALDQNTPLHVSAASGVLSNDSDSVVGAPLSIVGVVAGTPAAAPTSGVGSAVHGVLGDLVLNADGSYSYVPGAAAKSLGVGATATDTFTYAVSDGHGGTTSTTLTFTVTGINDAPTAAADTATLSQGGTAAKNAVTGVLSNDTDPDAGDVLTVSGVAAGTGAPVAAAVGSSIAGSLGHLTLNADGSYSYVADDAKSLGVGATATDTFTYSISDGHGGTSSTTLTFTVTGTNDVPIAHDDYALTPINASLSNINVLANDSDPDVGDVLSVSSASVANPALGSVSINPDGTLNFSPALNVSGPVEIDYTITDGHGGSASAKLIVTVSNNHPPIASADTASTDQNTPVSANAASGVLANDSDPDAGAVLSVIGVAAGTSGGTPTSGVASAIHGAYGDLTLQSDGSYTYTPNAAAKSLGAGTNATDTFSRRSRQFHRRHPRPSDPQRRRLLFLRR